MAQIIPRRWQILHDTRYVCEVINPGFCGAPANWETDDPHQYYLQQANYLCSSHYNKLVLPEPRWQVAATVLLEEEDSRDAYIADLERTVEGLTLSALLSGEIERRQAMMITAAVAIVHLNDADTSIFLKGLR